MLLRRLQRDLDGQQRPGAAHRRAARPREAAAAGREERALRAARGSGGAVDAPAPRELDGCAAQPHAHCHRHANQHSDAHCYVNNDIHTDCYLYAHANCHAHANPTSAPSSRRRSK